METYVVIYEREIIYVGHSIKDLCQVLNQFVIYSERLELQIWRSGKKIYTDQGSDAVNFISRRNKNMSTFNILIASEVTENKLRKRLSYYFTEVEIEDIIDYLNEHIYWNDCNITIVKKSKNKFIITGSSLFSKLFIDEELPNRELNQIIFTLAKNMGLDPNGDILYYGDDKYYVNMKALIIKRIENKGENEE